ncbi:MAG: mannose-6-phosphate isomerase, class I [Bdellovibrionales bacterium]|nr:mannose-6-phosphate isomerase, class I [Bdellovibrionales bacterium]
MEITEPCRVSPALQQYAWGRQAPDCFVAKLFETSRGPYAEAWLGAHLNGPAYVKVGSSILPLAEAAADFTNSALAKVLAVAQPLSIQVHPPADVAKQLHAADPENFPDPFAKHEAVVALTPFYALSGWRPVAEIAQALTLPQFGPVITDEIRGQAASPGPNFVKEVVRRLLSATPTQIAEAIEAIPQDGGTSKVDRWLQAARSWYPNDVGLLFFYLLQLRKLDVGDVLETPAGVPHAYLHGECLEVMAPSDNVARCGLTPKHIDCDAFLSSCDWGKTSTAGSPVEEDGVKRYTFAAAPFCIEMLERGALIDKNPTRSRVVVALDASGEFVVGDQRFPLHGTESWLLASSLPEHHIDLDRGKVACFSARS